MEMGSHQPDFDYGPGLGLMGFAAYCFVEAAFRIIPRYRPPDLQTLATRARPFVTR
jgi:hypothetical protein